MFTALGSNIVFGLIIGILGVVNSTFARRNLCISSYFVAGTMIALSACTLIFMDFSKISSMPYLWQTVVMIICASIFNNVGHLLSVSALKRGHNAAGWAIAQSAMIIPFIYGTFFAMGSSSIPGFVGMAAVLGGIFLLALNRRKVRSMHTEGDGLSIIDPVWLAMALGSLLCYGMAQTLMSVPSTWEGFADPANMRAPLLMGFSVVFQGGLLIVQRRKFDTRVLRYSLFYGLFLIACNSLVFFVLDRMTGLGLGNIVWPIAIGICIVFFSVYSNFKLRESFNRRDIFGLSAVILGLAMLALR